MWSYLKQWDDKVNNYFTERQMYGMKDIISFLFLTLMIHILWKFWENRLGLFPVHDAVTNLMDWLSGKVLNQSVWMLNTLCGYHVAAEGSIIRFSSGYDIVINDSCSGLKQIMQFVLLILVYRGKWINKLWFIPLGVILVHISNLLRVFFIGVLSMSHHDWMRSAHDYVLRWLFYLTICMLWLFWVKKIAPNRLGRTV